jgi:hypothetical protein
MHRVKQSHGPATEFSTSLLKKPTMSGGTHMRIEQICNSLSVEQYDKNFKQRIRTKD